MQPSTDNNLKSLSYYKTGGDCDYLFKPTCTEEVQESMLFIKQQACEYFLLGAGSNTLVLDNHWPGAVVCFAGLKHIHLGKDCVSVGAGVSNTDLSLFCQRHALDSLAWMYKLPGQIGASVRMNAKCYGSQMSDVVKAVTVVRADASRYTYTDSELKACFRGYKDTSFMDSGELIVAVDFAVKSTCAQKIKDKMQACFLDREKKGHFDYPSCGCVFKNDYHPQVSLPAGLMISSCGLMGLQYRGAQISPKHANFIYNNKSATSDDILELSFKVRDTVWQKLGVWLSYEMEVLGKLNPIQEQKFFMKKPACYQEDLLKKLRKKFRLSSAR